MQLRRHIAFCTVLIASAVMFAHIFVPHHHCSEDFSVCSPLLGIQHIPCDHMPEPGSAADKCDISHSIPSLFFLLRDHTGDHSQETLSPLSAPFFLCANRTDVPLPSPNARTLFAPIDLRRNSLWTPDAPSGRAPPVRQF